MKVSELIQALQAMQEEHGDLEVQSLVPEGPYNRLEGPPSLYVGHHDCEGEFYSVDDVQELIDQAIEDGDDPDDVSESYPGPFICIGEFVD